MAKAEVHVAISALVEDYDSEDLVEMMSAALVAEGQQQEDADMAAQLAFEAMQAVAVQTDEGKPRKRPTPEQWKEKHGH